MNFGENLKRIRKSRGLSQAELGELVDRTHACISRYEKGVGTPPLELVISLAGALGCRVSDLSGEEPRVIYQDNRKVGRWEVFQLKELGDAWTVQCSECKAIGFHGKTPYCPECGAQMQ